MKAAQIAGRLGKPIETEQTTGGTPTATFDLAVSYWDFQTKEKATEWVAVKIFGKTVDFLAEYAKPGDILVVRGEMTFERWVSKKFSDETGAGAKMCRMVLAADQQGVELFSKPQNATPGPNPVPKPSTNPTQETLNEAIDRGDFKDIDFGEDDLPF